MSQSEVPQPETFVFGLQEDLTFIMPPHKEDDQMDYLLNASRAIATAGLERAVKATVRLVPYAGPGAVQAYELVKGSALFDTTMTTMLETVGDVATETGILHLKDALREPSEAGKRTHRNRAAGSFAASYSGFNAVLRDKPPGRRSKRTELHRKATGAALSVSLINYQLDLLTSAADWADIAQEHHASYQEIEYDLAKEKTGGRDLEDAARHIELLSDWDGSRPKAENAKIIAANIGRVTIATIIALANGAGQRPGPPPMAMKLFHDADFSTKTERAERHRGELAVIGEGVTRMRQLIAQQAIFDTLHARLAGNAASGTGTS